MVKQARRHHERSNPNLTHFCLLIEKPLRVNPNDLIRIRDETAAENRSSAKSSDALIIGVGGESCRTISVPISIAQCKGISLRSLRVFLKLLRRLRRNRRFCQNRNSILFFAEILGPRRMGTANWQGRQLGRFCSSISPLLTFSLTATWSSAASATVEYRRFRILFGLQDRR
jgi:hypothetical protein